MNNTFISNFFDKIDKKELAYTLIDTIDQAIITTNKNGKIIIWNKGAENLYGWEASEVIGKDITEVTVPKMSQEKANMIMDKLFAGEKWRGSFPVTTKKGKEFLAYVIDSPVFDENDNLVGIVGVSHNIQNFIQKKEEELTQILSSRYNLNFMELMGSLTHKLNNLITVNLGNLDFLQSNFDDVSNEEKRNLIDESIESIKKIKEVVKQFSLLSGKKSLSASITDLTTVIKEMKVIIDMIEESHKLSIKYKLDSDLPVIILDESSLAKILINLIFESADVSLAKEFMISTGIRELQEDDIEKMENYSTHDPREYVFLKIEIGASLNQDISEKLENLITSSNLVFKSLSGFMHGYGEHLDLQFEKNNTIITLYFPPYSRNKQKINKHDIHEIKRNSNVLVVEDNIKVQKILIKMLNTLGLKPQTVTRGADAIELIKTCEFSLIIIDLKLPDISGIEIAKLIDQQNIESPYLIISGYHQNIDSLFREFVYKPKLLAKPFSYKNLKKQLNSFIKIVP